MTEDSSVVPLSDVIESLEKRYGKLAHIEDGEVTKIFLSGNNRFLVLVGKDGSVVVMRVYSSQLLPTKVDPNSLNDLGRQVDI